MKNKVILLCGGAMFSSALLAQMVAKNANTGIIFNDVVENVDNATVDIPIRKVPVDIPPLNYKIVIDEKKKNYLSGKILPKRKR